MLNLTFDLATGKLVLVSPVPLKATSEVPVTITFSSVPASATGLSIALGSGQTPQRTLAFNDAFSGSGATRTATLNANDTRMQAFMTGRGAATLDIEFAGVINGFIWIVHNVKVLVQAGVVTGPEASDDGPTYLTAGQVQGLIDDAVGAGAWQPLDSDLTAIAALSTTSFGRGALTDANAAAGRSRLGAIIGTNVQAYSSQLLSLAGVGDATINLTMGSLAAGSLGVNIPGGNPATLAGGAGSGVLAFEPLMQISLAGGNAFSVRNVSAFGYSAYSGRDNLGNERFAIGYGNLSSYENFAGYVYFETSDAVGGGSAKPLMIVQSTTYGGALAYDFHPRMVFQEDGYIAFFPRDSYHNPAFASPYLVLDHTNPILVGYGYLDLRGLGDGDAIVLRSGGLAKNDYYSFGGTLASNLGHRFSTAGSRGSQTLRFQIANDGVQSFVTLSGTLLSATGDGTGTGFLGFTAASSTLRLANTGTEIDLMVSSSSALGGTSAATFTSSIAVFPGEVYIGIAGPRWKNGTGTPEGAVSAPVSSFFSRTNGGVGTAFYVKESGSGNVGWAVVLTPDGTATLTNKMISGASNTLTVRMASDVTGTLPVANGGTGDATLTAYAPLFGGTTTTGAVQSGTVGTLGQVLTSNGAAALPTFQTAASGYALHLFGLASASPLASSTYYVGDDLPGALVTAYANVRVEIPKTGTISRVSIHVRVGSAGSSETVNHFIRLNDTTDVAPINCAYDALNKEGNVTGVGQAVTAGDFIALKIATPAWSPAPTGVRWSATVYITT